MPDDGYSVKVDRSQGLVEVTGPDKAWVAEQLGKLASVYEDEAPSKRDDQPPTPKKPKPKSTASGKSKAKKKGSPKAKVDSDLKAKLTKEMRKKLETFVSDRQAAFDKSVGNQGAIIATFLQDEIGIEAVNVDELYTVYDVMGWSAAGNPRSQLTNAKDRQGYFGGWSNGRIALTHKGENYGRNGSKA